jgi:alkylresorcinol/alkylpyrone synthase
MTTLERLTVTAARNTVSQSRLADAMRTRLDEVGNAENVRKMVGFVYEHSAIKQRHFEVDVSTARERADWYRLGNEAAESLAVRALDGLRETGTDFGQCDGFVVVSSTYAGFPSLSRKLQQRLGFPMHALCYDLSGLGCAGPTEGLYLATNLLQVGRCKRVCVLCVDTMGTYGVSTEFKEPPSMSSLVAHCLASDAAGAAVLSRGVPPAPDSILGFRDCGLYTRLWEDALDQNDLGADTHNQPLLAVGKDIRTRMLDELETFFEEDGRDIPTFFHPGGAALMRLVAERYPAAQASVDLSSGVMEDNGNVGAPSALFVLHRMLEGGDRPAPAFRVFALGPGIVTTALTFVGVEFLGAR